jgi:hypothetical protein
VLTNIALIVVSFFVGALLWGALGISGPHDSSSMIGPWITMLGLWLTGAVIVYPLFLALVSAVRGK